MRNELVAKAAEFMGSKSALAAAIGVKPPTIHQWINGDRRVPAARCVAIEKLTLGAVSAPDLRPDIDWAYLRATNNPEAA